MPERIEKRILALEIALSSARRRVMRMARYRAMKLHAVHDAPRFDNCDRCEAVRQLLDHLDQELA